MVAYRSHVRYHIGPLLGAYEAVQADPAHGRAVRRRIARRRALPALDQEDLQSLKAIIGEAQRRGLAAQNIASGVTVKMAGRHAGKRRSRARPRSRRSSKQATGRARPLLITGGVHGHAGDRAARPALARRRFRRADRSGASAGRRQRPDRLA